MSEIANSGEGASELEKPVQDNPDIKFPPFPEPTNDDFDEDIPEEERDHYKHLFKDLNLVMTMKLHCTACDRHLGCSARHETRMRVHPMLRTLVCHTCHTFYNSGEFEKGDDGSELYCRWCGQGGQVYCCSDCPHVFCAKCIKRNLGTPKIKEIEEADDWKCFKCNNRSLWDLRALCWALLRYCDLKNKVIYHTQNPELKEAYQKDSQIDHSQCCKHKTNKRNQKVQDNAKKKEGKKEAEAKIAATLTKMPCTIQVKKFASISMDESPKSEKKAQKRVADNKIVMKNPVSILPGSKVISPVSMPPLKKVKLPHMNLISPIRIQSPQYEKKPVTYTRIRPRLPVPQGPHILPGLLNHSYNGFNTGNFNMINDNINLSLESLTQGLDMSAVAASMASNNNPLDDDVVCTPDFPLEPLCEVTEDNDDDVQCITPGPVAGPKPSNPPPLVTRGNTDISSDNIIQMTENDVTVNSATGGLKFRVDPQTLSSNKMYRLPDGRIFAINANPNMPGGYSATIVAVTDMTSKLPSKGATYAAKLSAVPSSTPEPKHKSRQTRPMGRPPKRITKPAPAIKSSAREFDLHVPVEWFRYNLIDAVDTLEYALSRLHKLKKEATSVFLRSRTVDEMRNLHRTLERLLNTSSTRFNEVRVNLNKGLKEYVNKKSNGQTSDDDDDDDVEILADVDDDPIFIDENSVDSNINGNDNQEVDLTGAGSSEHNDSAENKKSDTSKNDRDPLTSEIYNDLSDNDQENVSILPDIDDASNVNREKSSVEKSNEKDDTLNNDRGKSPRSESIRHDESGETKAHDEIGEIKAIEESDKHKAVKEETKKTDESDKHKAEKEETLETPENDKLESLMEKDDSDGVSKIKSDEIKKESSEGLHHDKSQTINNEKMDTVHNESKPEKDNKANSSNNKNMVPNDEDDSMNEVVDDNNETKEKLAENDVGHDLEKKNPDNKADSNEKIQDTEMSEELIESLLKDDNVGYDSATNANSMDIPEELQEI